MNLKFIIGVITLFMFMFGVPLIAGAVYGILDNQSNLFNHMCGTYYLGAFCGMITLIALVYIKASE